MAVCAWVVEVAAAGPRVQALRARYDPVARLGMPAHITLLFPFMAPTEVDASVLRRVDRALHGARAFAYTLAEVGRFESVAYLVPSPVAPFVELTRRLALAFPEYPPYGGAHADVVPHLTVAHGDAAQLQRVVRRLEAALDVGGSIRSVCRSISLWDNASGRWRRSHRVPLT